jgi:hypothetical protein
LSQRQENASREVATADTARTADGAGSGANDEVLAEIAAQLEGRTTEATTEDELAPAPALARTEAEEEATRIASSAVERGRTQATPEGTEVQNPGTQDTGDAAPSSALAQGAPARSNDSTAEASDDTPEPALAERPRRRPRGGILLPGEEAGPTRAPGGTTVVGEQPRLLTAAAIRGHGQAFRLAHVRGALTRTLAASSTADPVPETAFEVTPTDTLSARRTSSLVLGGGVEVVLSRDAEIHLGHDPARGGYHIGLTRGEALVTTTGSTGGRAFVHTGLSDLEVQGEVLLTRATDHAGALILSGQARLTTPVPQTVDAGHQIRQSLSAAPDVEAAPRSSSLARSLLSQRSKRTPVRTFSFDQGPGLFKSYEAIEDASRPGLVLRGRAVKDQHWGTRVLGTRPRLFTGNQVVIRFRYFVDQPQTLLVRCYDATTKKQYMGSMNGPKVGEWGVAEVAVSVFDSYGRGFEAPPANASFSNIEILTGHPGDESLLLIDDLEIIALD